MLKALSEPERYSTVSKILKYVTPAFLLNLSGKIDLTFDDKDALKDHPLAGPAMMSFANLIEKFTGKSK